ncbi:UDP-N-acetylmuramoyl-L-alanyl-D-glutamate--2,6-diaminopimelate ligase [Shewanella indica]|uniref:UDP-N-acetylmuramoyl-L-alanyl-D-glutamate--2, 6-diaminopimelate ligase n=1 Tax=Shewanella indica TaxID=768528 RepID=UPI003999933F
MMLLRDLLAPWFHYSGAEAVAEPCLDSRKVVEGGLFVAVPGHQADGREYVAAAFNKGAAAALLHTDDPDAHGKVEREQGLTIYFFQLSRQLSALAAQFYGIHAAKPRLVGITGTNGKTSVSQLIAQWVSLLGEKAGVMGTLGNGLLGKLQEATNTTSDALAVMAQLKAFEQMDVSVCAMEVSSHGLVQGRVEAAPFEVAVFTNLSRDHLDYHQTMEAYAAAKLRLMRFASLKHAVINLDDATGQAWFEELPKAKLLGYSIKQDPRAAVIAVNPQYHAKGVRAEIHWPEGKGVLETPLLGEFNLSNLLAALTALYAMGYPLQKLLSLSPALKPVPGRMECFPSRIGFSLVVDYAHTPDALEQALKALRLHTDNRLWCVFGCGGDRDKGKRPLMARAAEAFADRLMVTSDNTRSEDPQTIIDEVMAGLTRPESALSCVDRVTAIKQVCAQAEAGDVILLAGKGHETYQEVAGSRHHYDERALALELSGGKA